MWYGFSTEQQQAFPENDFTGQVFLFWTLDLSNPKTV
jgi:hypothetical protein